MAWDDQNLPQPQLIACPCTMVWSAVGVNPPACPYHSPKETPVVVVVVVN